jgi:hypothetical protein
MNGDNPALNALLTKNIVAREVPTSDGRAGPRVPRLDGGLNGVTSRYFVDMVFMALAGWKARS